MLGFFQQGFSAWTLAYGGGMCELSGLVWVLVSESRRAQGLLVVTGFSRGPSLPLPHPKTKRTPLALHSLSDQSLGDNANENEKNSSLPSSYERANK